MEDLAKHKTFDESCAVLRSSQVQEAGMVMATPADQHDAGSRCLALVVGHHQDIPTHPFRRTGGNWHITRLTSRPLHLTV